MLSQCKEEVLSSVQSAYGGDFQERSEKKKKKSRNSTFQKYHSHAGRKSCTLFLIVNLCRLKEPRGPIPVVGGWGWVQFSSPASCKVARPGRRGIRRVCPLSHQVQHDLSRMPSFVDYLHPRKATAMGCISSTQPWHGEESSPHPHSPNPGAWVGGGKAGMTASHRGPFIRIPPPPHSHAHSCYPRCIGSVFRQLLKVVLKLEWPWQLPTEPFKSINAWPGAPPPEILI